MNLGWQGWSAGFSMSSPGPFSFLSQPGATLRSSQPVVGGKCPHQHLRTRSQKSSQDSKNSAAEDGVGHRPELAEGLDTVPGVSLCQVPPANPRQRQPACRWARVQLWLPALFTIYGI